MTMEKMKVENNDQLWDLNFQMDMSDMYAGKTQYKRRMWWVQVLKLTEKKKESCFRHPNINFKSVGNRL